MNKIYEKIAELTYYANKVSSMTEYKATVFIYGKTLSMDIDIENKYDVEVYNNFIIYDGDIVSINMIIDSIDDVIEKLKTFLDNEEAD